MMSDQPAATIEGVEPVIVSPIRYKTAVERSHNEILRGLCEVADGIKKMSTGLGMIIAAYARLKGLER